MGKEEGAVHQGGLTAAEEDKNEDGVGADHMPRKRMSTDYRHTGFFVSQLHSPETNFQTVKGQGQGQNPRPWSPDPILFPLHCRSFIQNSPMT